MFSRFIQLLGCLLLSNAVGATQQALVAVPTAWRLQEYIPDNVVVWYTGHPYSCGGAASGLSLPIDVSQATRNRFWATVAQAKATAKPLFVTYEDTTCIISSFGLQQE